MPDEKDSKTETPTKEEEKSPKPHANDVLCGRGGSINNHIGNENYRIIVNRKKRVYLTARFKREKRLIAASIVQEVRSLDPPGRFLARDSRNGTWYDIGDLKARDKTSQALREGAPEIRKEMEDDRKKLMEKYRNSIKENKEKAMEVDEEESNSSSEKSIHDEVEVIQSSPVKTPSVEVHHSSEESSKHESMRTAVARMKIRDEASWNPQHKHPQHSSFNSYPKPAEFHKEPNGNYSHQPMTTYHTRHPHTPQYNSYRNNSTQINGINNQKSFVEVKSEQSESDIEMEQIQEIWYPSNSYSQFSSSSNRSIPYHSESIKNASSENPYSPIKSYQSVEPSPLIHRDVRTHHQNGHHHDQANHRSDDSMPPPNPRIIYHHNLNANASRDSSMLDGLASFESHLKPVHESYHYNDNIQHDETNCNRHSATGAYSYSQSIPSPKFQTGRRRQDEHQINQDRQRQQEEEEQIQLYAWSTTGRLDLPKLDGEDRDRKRSRHLHRNRTKVHLGHLSRTNEARHTRPPSPHDEYGNNIYIDSTAKGNHAFHNTRDNHDTRSTKFSHHRSPVIKRVDEIVETRAEPDDWFCGALMPSEWPTFGMNADDATFCGMDICSIASLGGASLCGVFIEDDPNKNTEIEIAKRNQVLREAKSWSSVRTKSSLGSIGSDNRSVFSLSSTDKSLVSKGSEKGVNHMNQIEDDSAFQTIPFDHSITNSSFVWSWDGKKEERQSE